MPGWGSNVFETLLSIHKGVSSSSAAWDAVWIEFSPSPDGDAAPLSMVGEAGARGNWRSRCPPLSSGTAVPCAIARSCVGGVGAVGALRCRSGFPGASLPLTCASCIGSWCMGDAMAMLGSVRPRGMGGMRAASCISGTVCEFPRAWASAPEALPLCRVGAAASSVASPSIPP